MSGHRRVARNCPLDNFPLARPTPTFPNSWTWVATDLRRRGAHEEALQALARALRPFAVDDATVANLYDAMVGFEETGEPQPLPDLELSELSLFMFYEAVGQRDRAEALFNDWIRTVGLGGAAWATAMLGDPYYKGLLEEAGITW